MIKKKCLGKFTSIKKKNRIFKNKIREILKMQQYEKNIKRKIEKKKDGKYLHRKKQLKNKHIENK